MQYDCFRREVLIREYSAIFFILRLDPSLIMDVEFGAKFASFEFITGKGRFLWMAKSNNLLNRYSCPPIFVVSPCLLNLPNNYTIVFFGHPQNIYFSYFFLLLLLKKKDIQTLQYSRAIPF